VVSKNRAHHNLEEELERENTAETVKYLRPMTGMMVRYVFAV
jgi:hypothetical protein